MVNGKRIVVCRHNLFTPKGIAFEDAYVLVVSFIHLKDLSEDMNSQL